VAHLDRALLHGVERLQAGDDLAGGEDADVELAAGDLAQAVGEQLGTAVQRVDALREARRHAPLDLGQPGLDGGGGDGSGRSDTGSGASGQANTSLLEE